MDIDRMKLLMMDGVVAVGRDKNGIVIYVKRGFKLDSIPSGARIVEMDVMRSYFTTLGRVRPVVSGVSVAHYKGTAGTLGGIAKMGDRYVGIGANHVLALRWGNISIGKVGDPILQPGPSDGGKYPYDTIGQLVKWSEVRTDRPAYADAAAFNITTPINTVIPEIGKITGRARPEPGKIVKKFGRTSLLTYSRIEAVDVVAKVRQWGTVIFDKQFMVKQPFSFEGDSGSLILDEFNRVVGMVIAGNQYYTLASDIIYIESELGLRICGVNMVG